MSEDLSLDAFNRAEPARAEAALLACCASRRWAREVLARRPYRDLARLRTVAAAVLAELAWPDVEEALAAHPRIGERAAGGAREAAWSRAEQSGAQSGARPELREDLTAGNVAYEERFGHVFLICATGLSAETMLAELRERLGNDPETERGVVRAELGKIVELRLGKAFVMSELASESMSQASLSTHVLDTSLGAPVPDLPVRLEVRTGDGWRRIGEEHTDEDGRIADFPLDTVGIYRLVFVTGDYGGFYPEITVAFRADVLGEHLHVPLLLSPYGYTTYRGS